MCYTCSCTLRASCSTCSRFLRALVPHVPCALRALVLYVPRALWTLAPYMPRVKRVLYPEYSRTARAWCPRALVLLIPHLLEVFQVNILIRISCIIAWMSCASCAVGAGIIWAFLFGLRLIIVVCHFLKRNTATLFFRISNKSFQDLLTPLH